MRRRQVWAAQRAAALPKPEEYSGGPLTYGTPVSEIVEIVPIDDPHKCAKCGRTVGRGRFLHEKHCKGKAA